MEAHSHSKRTIKCQSLYNKNVDPFVPKSRNVYAVGQNNETSIRKKTEL